MKQISVKGMTSITLCNLMAMIEFCKGKEPECEYERVTDYKYFRYVSSTAAVKFTDGSVLVCVSDQEPGYSELTPPGSPHTEFYGFTP